MKIFIIAALLSFIEAKHFLIETEVETEDKLSSLFKSCQAQGPQDYTDYQCGTLSGCRDPKQKPGCVLAGSKVLMADSSLKKIENIKAGDSVLNRDLLPVKVLGVFSHPEGSKSLYSFGSEHSEGPVFTPDHQFISEDGRVGAVPVTVTLQDGFNEDTKVYYMEVEGDGTYIVNNFVARHELPDFTKWPLTFITLGQTAKVFNLQEKENIELLVALIVCEWNKLDKYFQDKEERSKTDDQDTKIIFKKFKTDELGLLFSNSTTASFVMKLYKASGSWLYKGGPSLNTYIDKTLDNGNGNIKDVTKLINIVEEIKNNIES